MDAFLEKFNAGAYAEAAALLEADSTSLEARLLLPAARAMAEETVNAAALCAAWEQVKPVLEAGVSHDQAEQARAWMAVVANTVYTRCNDWQKVEYGALQKDVSFERKEYVLKEFQRILLAADVEYRGVLTFLYGYAAIAAGMEAGAPVEFRRGALKNLYQACELQFEIGLQDEFDPLLLAGYACAMDLTGIEDGEEQRRELLDNALHGEKALARFEEFAKYAPEGKRKELEKEVKKARFLERIQFWKRIKKEWQK